jgi:hypothetical protein
MLTLFNSREHDNRLLHHPGDCLQRGGQVSGSHRRSLLCWICLPSHLARTDQSTRRHSGCWYWHWAYERHGPIWRDRWSSCLLYRLWTGLSRFIRDLSLLLDSGYHSHSGHVAHYLEEGPKTSIISFRGRPHSRCEWAVVGGTVLFVSAAAASAKLSKSSLLEGFLSLRKCLLPSCIFSPIVQIYMTLQEDRFWAECFRGQAFHADPG